MFVVIGIILFLAWLASYFFYTVGYAVTYALLFLAILSIIIHFVLAYRRRST